ncbi:hypothetical protein KUTeg_020207 [Tegillarca granosa]|uniref:Impact N-terminal domain-containing protein n=1 Tax=Tegillarca granosa TaxID=220873 RepID=A0ABQ9E7S9_TEGGR|nr:hypothetical protein KUTeg_020207 [Tegillarca granosa]
MSLPTEVLTAISQLPLIQSTLQAMNSKINEISEVQKTVQEMKADIWENPDGIESRLNYIGQQSGENFADTEFLKRENKKLRKDIDLLKAMVIKLDRRSIEQEREIVELKSRSMRDNILIHNLAEEDGENLKERVKRLGLEVDFVRIHRNAPHKNPNGKPRSITGKLVDLQQKEVILTTQRQKLNTKVQLPFYGNHFIAEGGKSVSIAQVRNIYKKVASNPVHASANHRILVYRTKDNNGKTHEGYSDDGEHGAGRKLLKVMQDQGLNNCTFVIVRRFGGRHLGPKRFNIMEDVMLQVAGKI